MFAINSNRGRGYDGASGGQLRARMCTIVASCCFSDAPAWRQEPWGCWARSKPWGRCCICARGAASVTAKRAGLCDVLDGVIQCLIPESDRQVVDSCAPSSIHAFHNQIPTSITPRSPITCLCMCINVSMHVKINLNLLRRTNVCGEFLCRTDSTPSAWPFCETRSQRCSKTPRTSLRQPYRAWFSPKTVRPTSL
jgi:hypothetical protein